MTPTTANGAYVEVSTARLRHDVAAAGLGRPCTSPDTDPESWFPVGRTKCRVDRLAAEAEAARLCAGCPVIDACLALALRYEADRPSDGIWGGMTPWQRDQLNPARRPVIRPSEQDEPRTEEVVA